MGALVVRRKSPGEFSKTTIDLLRTFVQNHDRVLTRSELLHEVWGIDFDPETNVVDVHVARLRRKLDRAGRPMIQTMRGEGYVLSAQGDG